MRLQCAGGCPDKEPKGAEQDGAEATHQKYALECTIEMTDLRTDGV